MSSRVHMSGLKYMTKGALLRPVTKQKRSQAALEQSCLRLQHCECAKAAQRAGRDVDPIKLTDIIDRPTVEPCDVTGE